MAAAVRADLGMVPFAKPPARADQGRVRHLGVGRRGDRPAQRHAAGAVRDGREARLAGGDAELGHVGDPQLVGLASMEVVPAPLVAQQVLGRLGNLALVRAAAALLPGGAGDQALVPHDVANRPLADRRAVPRIGVDLGVHAPVAVCAAAGLERLDQGLPGCGVLFVLAFDLGVPGVLVAALGHAHHGQDLAEPVFSPQRLHHRRLLLVRQQLWVGALVFLCCLEGRLAHVQLELHPPELYLRLAQYVLQDLDVVWQVVIFLARGLSLRFGFPAIIAHYLPSPGVGRRPRHAVLLGDLRGRPRPRLQLGDDLHLLLDGNRVPLRVRAPASPLPGDGPAGPIAEVLPAGGIAQPVHGPGKALSVREAAVHGSLPHLQGEPRLPLPLLGLASPCSR